MNDLDECHCGHIRDEHYAPIVAPHPEYPGSTACAIEGCPCDIYETAESYEEDEVDG